MALSRPVSLSFPIIEAKSHVAHFLTSPHLSLPVQLQPSKETAVSYALALLAALHPAIAVRTENAQPLKVLSLILSSRADLSTREASSCHHLVACNHQVVIVSRVPRPMAALRRSKRRARGPQATASRGRGFRRDGSLRSRVLSRRSCAATAGHIPPATAGRRWAPLLARGQLATMRLEVGSWRPLCPCGIEK